MITSRLLNTRDDAKEYWSRVEVCDKYQHLERGCLYETPQEFLSLVLAVPGVQEIWAKGYLLSVRKADSFNWEEIDPCIEELLCALEVE